MDIYREIGEGCKISSIELISFCIYGNRILSSNSLSSEIASSKENEYRTS